jgi:hypothetical protein
MILKPLWDYDVEIRASAGYKDNLLLSHNHPEGSAFIATGTDLSLWRISPDQMQVFFFLMGDDTRYLQSSTDPNEDFWVATARLMKPLNTNWLGQINLQYVYEDQVVDASITETNLTPLKATGHIIKAAPSLRRILPHRFWIEGEFAIDRDFFHAPLDNFWQYGPKLTLGRDYKNRSRIELSQTLDWRDYDTRNQTDTTGATIPGTHLTFTRYEVELALHHNWDDARTWRSNTRLLFGINRDNGSGYFDFERYLFSQDLRYVAPKWEIRAQGKVMYYNYDVQTTAPATISAGTQEMFSRRVRTEYILELRAERALTKHLKAFATFERDEAFSNRAFDEFSANTVSAGLSWEL